MNKILIYAVCTAIVGLAAVTWYVREQRQAEERGAAEERARVSARANQEIATRRARDVEFDKMDARQHCLDAGLEWVFDDGKSSCR